MNKPPALEPAIIVIFGITGDLSKRKLLPALYHLLKDDLLHEHTIILGVSRRQITTEQVLAETDLCINEPDNICDPAAVEKMRQKLLTHTMDLDSGEAYDELLTKLNDIEREHDVHMNRLYYLSIPPQVFGGIVQKLGEHGLNTSCQHGNASTRLLVEKPFGYDYESAEKLITDTSKSFGEDQVYRIDHYVAKETVQNILTFRFNNPIFEAIWDHQHIGSIVVTATEKIGIENRTVFYEQTGALRDLIQSHLLQILAVVTMEKPASMHSDDIHRAKLSLLDTIAAVPMEHVHERAIRGQYDTYRQEVNKPDSNIETYAGVYLEIGAPRWQGVPVLLRTGKALADKMTDVRVTFTDPVTTDQENILIFRIQPNEGISVELRVKKPGYEQQIQPAQMIFSYRRTFDDHGHPDAYERVLVDAVRGDHTLFATSAEILSSWRIVEPVLKAWQQNGDGLEIYKSGSWGPASAQELAKRVFSRLDVPIPNGEYVEYGEQPLETTEQ
jgi:glucose-6-phosphate 1-dehydrogenase